jgi:hypothetical protein
MIGKRINRDDEENKLNPEETIKRQQIDENGP